MPATMTSAGVPLEGSTARYAAALACGAVLLLEYLLVALVFDVQPALDRGGAWASLTWLPNFGLMAAIGAASACIVLVRLTKTGEGVPASPGPVGNGWRRRWGTVHVLALAINVLLTWFVLGRPEEPPGEPHVWMGLWALSAAGSAFSLLVTLQGRSILGGFSLALLGGGALLGVLGIYVGFWSQALWESLAGATLRVSYVLLRLGFPDAVADESRRLLGASGFHVEVAIGCSGYEGMGLIAVLTPAYLWAFRSQLRFPRAFWLLPIAVGAVWLGNAVRVATLVAVGALGAPELAVGAFHSRLGWVFFCAIAIGTLWLGTSSRYFARPVWEVPSSGANTNVVGAGVLAEDVPAEDEVAEHEVRARVRNPAAPYLVPMLSVFAVALLTSELSPHIDRLYALRICAGALAVSFYVEFYKRLDWRVTWRGPTWGLMVGVAWIATGGERQELPSEVVGTIPPLWYAMRVIGSVLLIPLVEELLFRGYLLRRMQASRFEDVSWRSFTWVSLVASSLIFGVLHGRWVAATLAGLIYAVVLVRTGRFGEAVAAHAASNLAIAVWVLTTGDWSHWL